MSKFKDDAYLVGYADALKRFSQEIEAYKDFAFESQTFNDDEVQGVIRMEAELQNWLCEHVQEIKEELE